MFNDSLQASNCFADGKAICDAGTQNYTQQVIVLLLSFKPLVIASVVATSEKRWAHLESSRLLENRRARSFKNLIRFALEIALQSSVSQWIFWHATNKKVTQCFISRCRCRCRCRRRRRDMPMATIYVRRQTLPLLQLMFSIERTYVHIIYLCQTVKGPPDRAAFCATLIGIDHNFWYFGPPNSLSCFAFTPTTNSQLDRFGAY